MSTTTLALGAASLDVLSGSLRLKQRGPWTGLVMLHSADPTTGQPVAAPPDGTAAVLSVAREDGTIDSFVGVARHDGEVPGSESLSVRLVGGKGGLILALPERSYTPGSTPLTAALVAQQIAADAGETLAPGVVDALALVNLPGWHRATGITAALALDLLAEEIGMAWRILPAGTLWIGVETWPASSVAPRYIAPDVDDGSTWYAPDGAPVAVGQAVADGSGGTVRGLEVSYYFAAAATRLQVRAEVPGDTPHEAQRDLYRAGYNATVIAQRTDGTLDVKADDTRIGDLLAVPFRIGIPGALVTIPEGSRVRVRFDRASPAGAYAADMDQDPLANKSFALVSDSVGYLSATSAGPGPVTFAVSPTATGAPGEVALSVLGPGHKYAKGVAGP